VDENGNKVAAVLNFKEFGTVWEDIEDILISIKRAKEPRVSLSTVKNNLKKQAKL